MKKYTPQTQQQINNHLEETEQTTILYNGLENALIGIGNQYTKPPIAIYSYKHIIQQLQKNGLNYEDAIEYAEYNIIGAWVGEQTPIIINDLD
jgi:hypothetical protein